MSDTLITVIAIMLAGVLIFVLPVMTMAEKFDTTAQSSVEAITSEFVDRIRSTGTLTEEDYNQFMEKLASTGNIYDVSLEFKILDENLGKKASQTVRDKIGENVYYSVYTLQIEEELEKSSKYDLKQGDIVLATVRNTNLTLAQEMKNFMYKVIGNDSYTIVTSQGGLVQ